MSEEDKRPQNIILEQADKRRGSDPLSAPETTQAVERVIPPALPASQQGGVSDLYSLVRSLVISTLSNNVTINGQAPEVAGGNINYSSGEKKSASTEFIEKNKPDTPAEVRKQAIEGFGSLEQRLHTPGLDSNSPRGTDKDAPKTPAPMSLSKIDAPVGIQRSAYAGKGQTQKPRSASKIRQSSRNRKDSTVPAKTELPNRVVANDTTQDAKTFVRLLVTRADGEEHSLINVDVSSATKADLENLPSSDSYYTPVSGGDLNMILDTYDNTFTKIGEEPGPCWRNGLYVGIYPVGGPYPALTDPLVPADEVNVIANFA